MIESLIIQIKYLSQVLPLEVFAFVGTFIEEVVGPIPSPLILITAGSLAHTQGHGLLYILLLSLIASSAKTFASWLFYVIADKAEDFLLKHFGHFFGVTHKEIEKIGEYFDGSRKDDALIFLARAIPIMPTGLVSFACGFIKLDVRSFVQATFWGFAVRSFMFLYAGYFGVTTYESLKNGQWHPPYFQIIIFILISTVTFVGYFFRDRLFPKNKPKA